MTHILIAIIVAAVLTGIFLQAADRGASGFGFLMGVFLVFATAACAIAYAALAWLWISSGHKVAIINREYGTNYTREEVFYASDVIETIRELHRNRYEINGNILHQHEDKEEGGK